MIPARLGSKRVPRKNLRLILGRPLVSYIISAAKEAGVFDEIYLNSEAEIFGEIAKEYGISYYKRDPKFSTDQTINDEFLMDFIDHVDCDLCFQLLPTSPLVNAMEIRDFVETMLTGSYDTLVSVEKHQIASIFEGQPINFRKDEAHRSSQEMKPIFSYATVLMGWKTSVFRQSVQKHGCGYHGGLGNTGYYELSGPSTIDIDEESDFAVAEIALKARFAGHDTSPKYYEPQTSANTEVDVPTILKKDGVLESDFSQENQPVTDLPKLLAEKDSSVSWCHRVINTESNSATIISQLPGEGNRMHYHPDWNEWWYILKGTWEWEFGGKKFVVKQGDLVFIPRGIRHKITALGNESAVRLAVSRGDVAHIYTEGK